MSIFFPRHYFNNINYTSYPFYISISVFCFIFCFLLYVNKYSIIDEYFLIFSLISILWYTHGWFDDITVESIYWGRYNRKVRSSLVCGFLLFLVSEVMLFSGFFWSFFDRFFQLSYSTFNSSVYYGFERLSWYKAPFKATIYLLASGYFYNYVYYATSMSDIPDSFIVKDYEINYVWKRLNLPGISNEEAYKLLLESYYVYGTTKFDSYSMYTFTLFFAFLFLFIQAEEYSELMFTMADGVYCSLFFLLTGFHGMHVIIGTLFISISFFGSAKLHYTSIRHLGVGFSLVYWHFVDIIWIFLFIFVYLLNNWEFLYLISDFQTIYHGL